MFFPATIKKQKNERRQQWSKKKSENEAIKIEFIGILFRLWTRNETRIVVRSEKISLKLGFFTVFEFSLPARAIEKSCKTARASSVQIFHSTDIEWFTQIWNSHARATPTTTDRNNLVKWYHVDRTRRRRRVVYLSNHQQSSFVSVSGSSLLNIICIFITFILLFRHRNAIASRRRQCSFLLRSLISLSHVP